MTTRPTHKPHVLVAHHRSRFIDGVDGVPSTHTQHRWTHAWTVTDGPGSAAPLPFEAKKSAPAMVAVSTMCALVLTAMFVALTEILDDRPDATSIVLGSFGLLTAWTALLAVPALVRSRR
ncbi:MAG: hypothetical protein ACRBK7_04005 [Acidimicrobiales bacterium]